MFCVSYEIGVGARSVGHTSFLFVPVFQGCLGRRHNVRRAEKCASPFYELLRNLHQDFTSASTTAATIAERLRLFSPPGEILRQSQALRALVHSTDQLARAAGRRWRPAADFEGAHTMEVRIFRPSYNPDASC